MDNRYLIFDLETEPLDGPLNLDRRVPRITVAATLSNDGDLRLWCERNAAGQVTGELMSAAMAQMLVAYLREMADAGYTIVTWNGSGFDFRVLARASGLKDQCIALAWAHVDMMFWFHCLRGFSIGLDKAAEAIGSGKTAGLSGADAPRLWAAGEYDRVLDYVTQDVRATEAVYLAALRNNGIQWQTTYGRFSKAEGTPLPVREAFKLPMPDTSWMKQKPWPRTHFVGWMQSPLV